ncbi:MAG: C4-dicarboxylate TRAP transporter substrate-binding protein, partial [Rhodospirillaceae bacterium]|nr:C4-dicarboxylate TRAP transporter substrate-binding protein [Rhodospirillaceae bacterium]
AEIVEELSGGDLQPEVYTGTVLLEPRASLQGIMDNVVQVAHHAAVYTPSELPVANAVQELGFNYDDPLVAIMAVTEFSIENAVQQQEWEDHGIVYLGAYATPAYIIFCREPVRNLEEIQGMRIRTAGSTVSQWVEEVGGIPVNVPSSEMYTGLERGTLDCASNAPSDLIARSLYEVAEHTTLLPTGMYWAGPHWGYNAEFWASLSPEQRHILMEATALSMARLAINYVAEGDEALAQAVELGGNVYEPEADLIASVEEYRARALEMAAVTAEETYGVEDGEALIADFVSYMDKWADLIASVDRTDENALAALAMQEIYDEIDPATYGVYE